MLSVISLANGKLEKKYAPTLDMDKVVLLGVIFKKMKCFCKTQMMPPPDHKKL